jgi:hypothetical protein
MKSPVEYWTISDESTMLRLPLQGSLPVGKLPSLGHRKSKPLSLYRYEYSEPVRQCSYRTALINGNSRPHQRTGTRRVPSAICIYDLAMVIWVHVLRVWSALHRKILLLPLS